jgi:hypothetical protein
MADVRSTYLFEREDDYNDAVSHLRREMYDDYSKSNSGGFCFWGYTSGNSAYRIDILTDCSDAPKAADIIREHRGKYYD